MKALSLLQPWASLVVCGAKRWETRSWATKHRGLVAIHASAGKAAMRRMAREQPFFDELDAAGMKPDDLPCGVLLGVANLVDCIPITDLAVADGPAYVVELPTGLLVHGSVKVAPAPNERFFGNYAPDRWAWLLRDVRALPTPIPCKGMLGLWQVPDACLTQVPADLLR